VAMRRDFKEGGDAKTGMCLYQIETAPYQAAPVKRQSRVRIAFVESKLAR